MVLHNESLGNSVITHFDGSFFDEVVESFKRYCAQNPSWLSNRILDLNEVIFFKVWMGIVSSFLRLQ